jgi:hypothetical protein
VVEGEVRLGVELLEQVEQVVGQTEHQQEFNQRRQLQI